MKAIDIQWDTDGEDVNLPDEIEIPPEVAEQNKSDPDAISDYISDVTGFCHKGFVLDTDVPEER